ncbi:DUF3795 domain-containing protein [Candidatus Fermentibacterales bacterium]|nr:DUF3795 domain-containing protein [Candidatus Fermentibacterales bacterium]
MDGITAYCGLVCTHCPAWKATSSGDEKALEEIASTWSKEWGVHLGADDCRCTGCLGNLKPQIGYLEQCEIRRCAIARGLSNCAQCGDYACATLERWFEQAPSSRTTLEEIRRKPAGS